ncbi:cytochrome ubiquinol oxidase subunit I [Geodermatophilus ruber]|uniref:Cytochrome bd-I ubiquinol oxidase subunit 1 apoprotein n=1 Tax=Geodermatophilus ruber TaxID=504800 RepID=A0A1I4LXC1_9ACTN|nr:cytochrome ubiquinol oxidase subunit I [Geodermatophilus ruber]SFL95495.1 cytochrome bd-I ubiquinol oxidase subunit 1 apoprotein [Geodermatophilus ruber]
MSGAAQVLADGAIPERTQYAAALAFHIVFACFGIAFPAVVLTVHRIGLRRRDPAAVLLARRWSKMMAVIFAVGAVSGMVLSFGLGLLWPGLMRRYGAAFGIPFSVEGIWFFTEAVFLAIYIYGWRRLPPRLHWWLGTPLVVAAVFGAWSVVAANSWMNTPGGFTLSDGRVTDVDPWAVFFNRASLYEVPHMILAAYMVVGFTVAGIYAVGLLRGRRDRYHRLGFGVPFAIGAIAAPLQVLTGDWAARKISEQQPLKFAAMELVDHTHSHVTEWIGGIYLDGHVYFGIGIPSLDSILVGFRPDTVVIGWDSVRPRLRPPWPNLIHLSFDLMVGIGFALLVLGAWQGWIWYFRRSILRTRWFLVPTALSGAAAILAVELGWIVTEVGRQPWVVYGYLLTEDADTTAGGVLATLIAIFVIYAVLTAVVIGVPWTMSRRWRRADARQEDEEQTPYGPPPAERAERVPA